MDASASFSQLEAEIAVLIQSVAQLETEISLSQKPLCEPTNRFIDLEPFRKTQESFRKWDQDSEHILKDMPAYPDGSQDIAVPEGGEECGHKFGGGAEEPTIDDDGRKTDSMCRTIEDGSCLLATSQSEEIILTDSSDPIPLGERIKIRVLAVLRSYLHNLKNGTLAIYDKLDEGVAAELKDLVAPPRRAVKNNYLPEGHKLSMADSIDLSEKRDKEGIIYEARRYRRDLSGIHEQVEGSLIEAAQEILDWDK